MKKILYPVIMGCLFLPLSVFALELIYPADSTFVPRSNYIMIRTGDVTAVDGVSVSINGVESGIVDIGSQEYRAAFDDFLILQPEFDVGENRISVDSYLGNKKQASVQATIYFQPDPAAGVPEKFKKFVMHRQGQEAYCANCHNMQPSESEMMHPDPRKNACASCHARMLLKKHVHGPAGSYGCLNCHQPQSTPNKYAVGNENNCLECHDDDYDNFKKKSFVHGPVEVGLCVTCHDPHASDVEAQLVLPVNELCLQCHAGVDLSNHATHSIQGAGHPVEGPMDPIRPGRSFTCASCHDPHGGEHEKYLRGDVTNKFALCQRCHSK